MDESQRKELVVFARGLLKNWPTVERLASAEDLVHWAYIAYQKKVRTPQVQNPHVQTEQIENPSRAGLATDRSEPKSKMGFLRTVIRNKAIDIDRKHKREVHVEKFEDWLESYPSAPLDRSGLEKKLAAGQTALRYLSSLADTLQRIAWAPAARNRFDRYAIFVFYLHCRLFFRVGRGLAEQGSSVQDSIDLLFPWSQQNQKLRIKSNWPTLSEIWAACRSDMDVAPHTLDADRIALRIGELMGSSPPFNTAQWYQWVRRAKKAARRRVLEQLGEERWCELFVPILESHAQATKRSGE
jgi:hypothetical protein